MIRQAKSYLVGALSGVTLIGIAIAAFVVIVSAQVFHEWPIADTGAHAEKSRVAPAKALAAPGGDSATAAAGVNPALRANRDPARSAATAARRGKAADRRRAAGGAPTTTAEATGPATAVESPSSNGVEEPSSSGGDPGSNTSKGGSPPSSSQGGSPSSSSGGNSSGTANSGTSSGSTGSGNTSPGSGTTGTGGGSTGSSGGSTGETPVTAVTNKPAAENINGAVNEIDEKALGGTLEKAGVTEVTEGVVNGVAGPESVVGKTVEGVGEAVGGLLGGKSSSGE